MVTNVITALTSNQMIAPSIWIDPKSGNDYFLTAQYPEAGHRLARHAAQHPGARRRRDDGGHEDALLLRNVATISPETQPAEAAHYNIQRVVDVLVRAARRRSWAARRPPSSARCAG